MSHKIHNRACPLAERMLVAAVMLVSSSVLTGCQALLFSGLNATSSKQDVRVTRNVIFDAEHQLALDVFEPKDATGAPVVVFFYGGSWKSGKRQWYSWVGEALAKRGLVVVIPDYRLWPKVKLKGFMQDGARAVAWSRAHAGEFGGNPNKLFVMGHSAGAHIGALLATDARWLNEVGMKPRQLSGFIGLAGPYDFLPLKEQDYIDMFGSTHEQQMQSQPVHFVNGDEPPMLLMQGTDDKIVAPKNAKSLAQSLRAQNEPVEVKMFPDIGHLAILFSMSRPFRGEAPVIDDAVDFIHQRIADQQTVGSQP